MATTNSVGKILNPLSTSRTGGVVPSANIIVDVADWAEALEPRRTPILSRCKKGKAVNAIKHEWGQSYHTPISGTIAEDLTDSETDVDLASGNGDYVQPWMVLEVIDWQAGSDSTRLDYSTREEIVVRTVDGSDTIPAVQRGAGGTTAAVHSSGAYWGVVGVALPYSTDFQLSPFTRGDRLYNFPQRFYAEVSADVAARHTPDYEIKGDALLHDLKEQQMLLKHYLERAVVSGGRQEGDANGTPTTTTQNPYKFGGIDYFITNHSGRVVNMSGNTLSAYDLEDVLADMYKEIDDGGAKTLVMGVDTARIFDTLLNPIRQATMADASINLMVDTLKFRWGKVEINATQHMPEGSILFVDFSDISVHPYAGCNWSTKTIATNGPYDKMAVWGDFTMEVKRVTRMAKLHNFNTDLTAYPRREWF
jgi:hypothetical protein